MKPTKATERVKRPVKGTLSEEQAKEVLRRRSAYERNVQASYVGVYRRAWKGRSLRAAINAKCLDCCCQNRIVVRNCSCVECPLWDYRPYQVSE